MAMWMGMTSAYRMSAPEAALLLVITVAAAFALHFLWERPARLWARDTFLPEPSPTAPKGHS
ncbi:hypothetical protein [Brevundimonas vesicularis]|uniref:hypothetical protein n=1 Tax=Brevundimonas vesicularis TaxID=41276 RepID=UPI00082E520C|nr:hypothetical protein [Brevundimonas vesicularis]